ncbi:MAG: nucleotidyltransferase domain-containing protein [Spirochaetia bacterium]|jgi:predicted nucleotidyltransferase
MIRYERLPSDILQRIPSIGDLFNRDARVLFAYLFGGLASGELRPLSDVDIAVFLKEPPEDPAELKLSLFDSISDTLGTSEIDLVILNYSPISLVGRVLQNKAILVDKEPYIRHRFESAKLREFFDFRIKEEAFFERRFAHG